MCKTSFTLQIWGSENAKPLRHSLQEEIAINKEVLACVSNSALITPDGKYGMLKLWIDGVQRAGVKNYMVIAIDDQVRRPAGNREHKPHATKFSYHPGVSNNPQVANTMKSMGVPYWRKDPRKTADKEASNHGISAMKFQLIRVGGWLSP
jgi:hypothetical protein